MAVGGEKLEEWLGFFQEALVLFDADHVLIGSVDLVDFDLKKGDEDMDDDDDDDEVEEEEEEEEDGALLYFAIREATELCRDRCWFLPFDQFGAALTLLLLYPPLLCGGREEALLLRLICRYTPLAFFGGGGGGASAARTTSTTFDVLLQLAAEAPKPCTILETTIVNGRFRDDFKIRNTLLNDSFWTFRRPTETRLSPFWMFSAFA